MATDATSQASEPNATQPDGANTQPKVTYTPEQQAHIDNLIKEAQGRAAKELQTKYKDLETKFTETQEQLKTFSSQDKTKDSPSSKDLEEALRVNKTLQADLENFKKEILQKEDALKASDQEKASLRRKFAMRQAASHIPFHKFELVEMMTEKYVREDENGNFFIVKEDGVTPHRNSRMENMSLPEYYEEFAGKEKWSVKSEYVPGAGSSESAQGSGKSKLKAEELWGKDAAKNAGTLEQNLKRENPAEHARLVEEGRAKGLLGMKRVYS